MEMYNLILAIFIHIIVPKFIIVIISPFSSINANFILN